jgi:uncharacterized protein DUF4426
MRYIALLFVMLISNAFAQGDEAQPIETSKTFGSYTVFYNAFPSTTLLPAVAADYKIERGNDIAFINIAVRKQIDGSDTAQAVTITGTYSDLMQKRPLEFREIREQNAIYYIAQVRYGNREVLRFDVQVQPQLNGEPAPIGSPFKISFTRKFFTEP